MGNLLDRKALLAKEELSIEKVELDNGNHVFVRQMTGRERDKFEQSLVKITKNSKGVTEYNSSLEDFRAKLAVCTVCDDKGVLLLKVEDAPTLSQNMSARNLETIINKAQELNKISEEDKEELTKNSVVGHADNSTSNSVEN